MKLLHHGAALVPIFALVVGCPRPVATANPAKANGAAKAKTKKKKKSAPAAKKTPPPPPPKKAPTEISTKPRVKRERKNQRSAIGTNLIRVNFQSTEWAFLDGMKSADWWVSATVDRWGDGRKIPLDGNGWPKSLERGQRANTIVPAQKGGSMVIRYRGKGAIELSGTEGPVDALDFVKPGRITFEAHPKQALILSIVETDPKDPVRDIQVFAAEHEKLLDAGQVFNPVFLDRLAPFKAIRFMDWQHTNSSPIVHWHDRTIPTYFTQAVITGISYEYMILLANTVGADPWFCLPHAATDDFVAKFATMLRDELDPSLVAYLEYSNEVWHDHPEFSQALYARQQGEKLGLHRDNGIARLMFQTKRSNEMMAIVESILPPERRVRVLGSQIGNHYAHEEMLRVPGTKDHVDAIAVNAYFGHEVGGSAKLLAAKKPEKVLDFIEKYSIPEAIRATRLSYDWGKKRGLRIIAYEGGQHLVANPSRNDDPRIAKLLDGANRHKRMGRAYKQLLDGWKANGGELFVHFTFAGEPQKWGRFGMLERLDQPRKEAVKYDALLEFIEKNPRWWK